ASRDNRRTRARSAWRAASFAVRRRSAAAADRTCRSASLPCGLRAGRSPDGENRRIHPCRQCQCGWATSHDLELGQILAVDQADGLAAGIDHDEVVDLVLLEQTQRVDAERVLRDYLRIARHEGGDGLAQKIRPAERAASEIAVGQNSAQPAVLALDQGDAA